MQLIKIQTVHNSSITEVSADYLILKNAAEGLFGPEEKVNHVLGGKLALYNTPESTQIGAVTFIDHVEGIQANSVALVGIGSGFQLRYETIYQMCAQAIKEMAVSSRRARVIATVTHGVGFGLDQLEVFKTELYSFKAALELYQQELDIKCLVFNSTSLENANRLSTYLDELSSGVDSFILERDGEYFLQLGIQSSSVKAFATRVKESKYIFVAMPFSDEFENIYDFGIRLPIEENGLLPVRTDKQYFTGIIIEEIKTRIRESSFVIADISTSNPNVFFELGFAQGCNKPVVIICRIGEQLAFDVSGMNVIFYNPNVIRELKKSIAQALQMLAN